MDHPFKVEMDGGDPALTAVVGVDPVALVMAVAIGAIIVVSDDTAEAELVGTDVLIAVDDGKLRLVVVAPKAEV